MLKNKSKLIAFILIAVLLFFVPISFADEGEETMPISEESVNSEEAEGSENSEEDSIKNMKSSDVYLVGDDITIDYVVDGNVFAFGKNVTINAQIGGDVFVFANNLTIGSQGAIYSNLFTIADNVEIQGIAYDLYAFTKNITISGYVYRDARIACGNLNLFGRISRNAFVFCDGMNFVPNENAENQGESTITPAQGVINGTLEYSSTNEISIPENSVLGEIKYTNISSTTNNSIQTYLISLGSFLVTTIVLWLLCLWLTPKFIEKTSNLASKKIFTIIGFGILGLIAMPILSILLLTVELTSTIALLLLTIYFVLISLGASIFAISIANCIANKFKINKTIGILGILILSSIILWLLKLIPVVGGIISLVYTVVGIGIVLSSLIHKNSIKTEETSK